MTPAPNSSLFWHQLLTDWNLQSWHTSAHVGAHSGSHHRRPRVLLTQSFGEIFSFLSPVFRGFCLVVVVALFVFSFYLFLGVWADWWNLGEIKSNSWAPSPRDIAYPFSIPWRMALPFILETYSHFSNPNFSCHFQTHLPVKLQKTCERNKHLMMAKGPKNLQENTWSERHSPKRQWISQTGSGSREEKPPSPLTEFHFAISTLRPQEFSP